LDDGAFDEPAGGFAFVGSLACFLGALAGPLVLDVTDGEPQRLDDGVVVGEVAPVLDDLAELVVQRLDGVGGVDDLAGLRGELEERDEPLPGVLPGRHGGRVAGPSSPAAKSNRALSAASTVGAV
jgi:hypothetical protein